MEDNKDIGYILQYFLTDEGFEVSLFETVSDFNSGLSKKIPDLFLLDVMLPDGDGLLICDEIKHKPESMNKPVLIMSAHSKPDLLKKGSCADEFIPKPFDIFLILNRINNFLE